MPGLYLLVQPSGAKSWCVRYRYHGHSRKFTIGTWPTFDLRAARRLARQALQCVELGGDPAREKKLFRRRDAVARDDFESIARLFIERHAKPNNRRWEQVARCLGLISSKGKPRALEAVKGGLVAKWGARKVGDIRRGDIIMLIDDIATRGRGTRGRGAPMMANRMLAQLRKLFNWAIDRDLVAENPCVRVPRARATSRDRVLTDDELKAIWHAAGTMGWPFGSIVQLLILTGQRRAEVAGMQWTELSLEKQLWTLPRERVKNNSTHEVPLSEAALEVIQKVPRLKGADYLFSTTGRNPVSGFSNAKDRLDEVAGVSKWRFHDIRRTVASGMARLSIALPVIEKVLNHRSGTFAGIVGVYQRHSFADEKRAALDAWARFVTTLVSDKPADNVVALRV
jgi:integrase